MSCPVGAKNIEDSIKKRPRQKTGPFLKTEGSHKAEGEEKDDSNRGSSEDEIEESGRERSDRDSSRETFANRSNTAGARIPPPGFDDSFFVYKCTSKEALQANRQASELARAENYGAAPMSNSPFDEGSVAGPTEPNKMHAHGALWPANEEMAALNIRRSFLTEKFLELNPGALGDELEDYLAEQMA